MSKSLFSESWYRVSGLKPRLRNHAQVHRHVYRGSVWYVLQDHANGRFHRFTSVANLAIGLMNGERTMQTIWDTLCAQLEDEVPSQDELIKLLSDLYRADVLQGDAPPDIREQHQRREKNLRQKVKQYIGNPLSVRIPLYDPDRQLARFQYVYQPIFGVLGGAIWCFTIVAALVLLGLNWSEFSDGMLDRVFSAENLLIAWFVFPALKILHELGHAMAVKVRGGEVHEMGVMLLLLMPIPYVDASSAAAFADKRWRMLTGAAGMLVEMFVAAVALIVWVNLEPGTGRAVAYNIVLIAGVSTLVFNGNPLLRFDGYYILADYLEIPNLGQRANEYWMYLLNHYVFKAHDYPKPVRAKGEVGWFLVYGFASFWYRMFMMVTIVWLVIGKYFLVGVVLAIWSVANTLLQPLGKGVKYLLTNNRLSQRRFRALVFSAGGVFVVWVLLFGIAAPSYTVSEGVVWAPEESQVRASVDCFVTDVKALSEEAVVAGRALIGCQDSELLMRAKVLQAELQGLEAKYRSMRVNNQVQAEILGNQIAHARVALNLAQAHIDSLSLRSPIAGTFQVSDPKDLPGRHVQRGEILGYVTSDAATIIRVVVPQSAADKVREGSRRILARPVKAVETELVAQMLRSVPRATNQLPSFVISTRGGGKFALDPQKPDEPVSVQKVFLFDVQLQPGVRLKELGSRVYVRFEHDPEPIGYQWVRNIQGAFMNKIDV